MPASSPPRPIGVTLAVIATVGLALFTLVMAVLSLASGHGRFSGGVALALVLWGLLVGVMGVFLYRGAWWARGSVVAAGLLHVFAFGQFALDGSPWAWLGAAAGLVSAVGVVLPTSTAWLRSIG
ncbi:MAG: hypothetical protein Q4F65_04575 [Propionibacteriaceae bacterium]|nr:hypothetical protein [Propionibacteriaceae bacterium]